MALSFMALSLHRTVNVSPGTVRHRTTAAPMQPPDANFLTDPFRQHLVNQKSFWRSVLVADIIELIKKQSEKRLSDLRDLAGKLSEQRKQV